MSTREPAEPVGRAPPLTGGAGEGALPLGATVGEPELPDEESGQAGGVHLRLPRSWPWAQTLAAAFAHLQALPSG